MTYEKDMTFSEKFEHFCNDELRLNITEIDEILDLEKEFTYKHASMDEEAFKAKMRRFCELIMSGLFKQILKDSFDKYLERM
jgi:hypothetical protein